jgi:hypothetical protein
LIFTVFSSIQNRKFWCFSVFNRISIFIWIATAMLCFSAYATTWTVNTTSDDPTLGNTGMATGSLPFCILNAAASDTIDCHTIAPATITLMQSLPALRQTITITGDSSNQQVVTIAGGGNFSAFQIAAGTSTTISNFVMQNCKSIGGAGGSGEYGGGGGAGGGAGLYLHKGVTATVNTLTFMGNQAVGGAGGAATAGIGSGGGGGGFEGGAGGAGNGATGGGGGGSFSNGGSGGSGAVGASGVFFGGGGGGGGTFSGGGAFNGPVAQPTNLYAGGTSGAGLGGGGGAGAGGGGVNATGANGTNGGIGIGSDTVFGGGGGGGGGGGSGQTGGTGGTGGFGSGGGGGQGTPGKGGFGGGGGAGMTAGGSTVFGGGVGGTGTPSNGGGGAGMGGAIFVGNGAVLQINDGMSISGNGNGVMGGAAGTGGGGAAPGGASGPDIFLQSGGTLNFNLVTSSLTISSAIASDNGAGGGSGGGLTLQGMQTLTLTGTNTYTGGTTVTSGTLAINSDSALGAPTFALNIGPGTLQTTQAFTIAHPISLTGAAVLDTLAHNITISSIITGSGPFSISDSTDTGSSVTLSGANTYTGETKVGDKMTLIGTTTSLQGNISVQNASSSVIFNQAFAGTYSGVVKGPGSLTAEGGGTVTLRGANTYSGGTNINAGTTLIGDTTSLQGNIVLAAANSTLTFDQGNRSGTYSGVLSGSGTLNISSGTVPMTGSSPGFTGTANVLSGAVFQLDGSIANASLTNVMSGGTLIGTGTTGNVQSSGTISPGDTGGTGTINVGGTLTLAPSSNVNIGVVGTSSGLIQVTGNAMLNGNITFTTTSTGFLGFGATYLVLSSAGLSGTMFTTTTFVNSAFTGTVTYTATDVFLNYMNTTPFANFPFATANERHVGEYLDALSAAGVINPALVAIVNSMNGFNNSQINDALDQMHPAIYSALIGGRQPSVGGQLLSLFHRRPYIPCGCSKQDYRIWAVPMGNWLREGNLGEQTAYEAQTRGVVAGFDKAIGENWVFGVGAAWNESDMLWQKNRGFGHVHEYVGSVYTDYMIDCFYCGISVYAGFEDNNITRHIQFSTNNVNANGHFNSIDTGGQFSAAYLFGAPSLFLYPYANVDYFYFHGDAFTETGAGALDLQIETHTSSTMRMESGIGLQCQDSNWDETICVSPAFELGWAMELPIDRPAYHARFVGEPFGFEAKGWDHTFQMFTVDAALAIKIYGFTLSGEYRTEMALEGRDNFWDQRCNLTLEYTW